MVKKILVLLLPLMGGWSVMAPAQELEFHSPKRLPPSVNSAGEESLPLLGPKGDELFFTRSLYAGNYGGKFSGMDVWFAQGSAGAWKNASNGSPLTII